MLSWYGACMRKALLIAILIGIVLVAGAIAILLFGDQGREELVATDQQATSTPITVATSTIFEESLDYQIDAEYPRFGIPAIDSKIQARIVAGVASLKSQASEDQPAKNDFPQYQYAANFGSVYIGDSIISVRFDTGDYTGGAHGLPYIFGMNFDRASGRELTLDDALALTGRTLTQIATEAKTKLTTQLGDDILDITGADARTENYAAFYITKKDVVFIFQPYQVAPYAAGAPEVAIPRVR